MEGYNETHEELSSFRISEPDYFFLQIYAELYLH